MARMLRNRFVLLSSLLVFCIVQYSPAVESSSQRLVSPKLLEHANLKILWENTIPIKNNENLERLRILGDHIYIKSNRNYMVSFNRETGDMIFGGIVAPDGLPVTGIWKISLKKVTNWLLQVQFLISMVTR